MSAKTRYVEIAVSGPMRRTFTYQLNDKMPDLIPGQRVLVPFGKVKKEGFYLRETERPAGIRIRPVIKVLDEISLFNDELFTLCLWVADYYFANPADCLSLALPPALKKQFKPIYRWAEKISETPQSDLFKETWLNHFQSGRKIPQPTLMKIRSYAPGQIEKLIKQDIIRESWQSNMPGGKKLLKGYRALNFDKWTEFFQRRKVTLEFFDGTRDLGELEVLGWTGHYIREALRTGLIEPVYRKEASDILAFVKPREDVRDLELTDEQRVVCDRIIPQLNDGFKPFLLHGITGSGKTIVYCRIAGEVIKEGRTVLVLTPEIALSGATLAYFRGFFGDLVTVIHSAMTERERLESWQGIRESRYKIVVGPRSALFAPLPNPGLVIIDEEHDSSYKQDDPAPRFHGREAAIKRAEIDGVPVILGSASPSLESYYKAAQGEYELLKLTKRPGAGVLPTVQVVDMTRDRIHGDLSYLSFPLKKEIERHLEDGNQVILFLNRRGYSPQLKCLACGHVPDCPHCQIHLTYHRTGRRLICHYCGYVKTGYDVCEKCSGKDFIFSGAGTQKIEENLPRLFEMARIVRFDSDTASGRKNAHAILSEFASGKNNLLLGTQMVTKGLDLPGVTLVGVLSADMGLDFPDFRSTEKTFARLLQVAGRSGRREKKGKVLIQTYYAESPLIDSAARQDYEAFYREEIESRKISQYPPFVRLVRFVFLGNDDKKLEEASGILRRELERRLNENTQPVRILGPAPCPFHFLRNNYRRQLLVKVDEMEAFVKILDTWLNEQANFGLPSTVRLNIDVDPVEMM